MFIMTITANRRVKSGFPNVWMKSVSPRPPQAPPLLQSHVHVVIRCEEGEPVNSRGTDCTFSFGVSAARRRMLAKIPAASILALTGSREGERGCLSSLPVCWKIWKCSSRGSRTSRWPPRRVSMKRWRAQYFSETLPLPPRAAQEDARARTHTVFSVLVLNTTSSQKRSTMKCVSYVKRRKFDWVETMCRSAKCRRFVCVCIISGK